MEKFAVILGDLTSHGGKVLSASSSFEMSGKNAALLNDMVTCPEHGTNKIIECDISAYQENGRGIVLHGCKTQCGSVVIAASRDMEVG